MYRSTYFGRSLITDGLTIYRPLTSFSSVQSTSQEQDEHSSETRVPIARIPSQCQLSLSFMHDGPRQKLV
jgi:hypothetical protein